METFKYINREYTPSVDLTTLGKTFDTLEQGHKEAVKTASELKSVIAALDMNEAEDGFKQSLLDEIESTIDNNTIYGNSYAALDDIITKSGDIASDGRVIGRLRNQAAKKEYDAKVDAMAIPDGMKEMYKEENPYEYVEGETNERTGKTAPGALWKPKTTPVKTVADADIQTYALKIAAEESGGYQNVTFLDKNGKPTPNPEESVDGLIYQQKGTTYQKLPEDKIARAYRVAINSIPGAEDSLRQDFKYAEWQYDKLVEKNRQDGGDVTPYVPGLTDSDGNIYVYDQWLNNKINNFSDVAAYNKIVTTIDFGTALQNYRTANPIGFGSGNGGKPTLNSGNGFGTVGIGYEKVEVDSFVGAQQAKNAAEQQALSVMKGIDKKYGHYNNMSQLMTNLMIRYQTAEPSNIVRYIAEDYGDNMSNEDIIKLNNAIIGYNFANQQTTDMIDASKDKDALLFSADVSSNIFTSTNKYSKEIIETLNDIYKDGEPASFTVGRPVLEELARLYGKTNVNDLRKLGINIISDGNYYIVDIPAEHRNELPRFYSTLRKAENNIPGTFGSGLTYMFTRKPGQYNYKQNQSVDVFGIGSNKFDDIEKLGRKYNRFVKKAAEAEQNAGVTDGYVTLEGYDQGSFAALWYRENHVGTLAERKSLIEQAEARVDNMLANALVDVGLIKELDENGVAKIDVGNNQDRRNLIQKLYSNDIWKKTVSRSCIIPNGVTPGQSKGYKLTFTVPKGANTGNYKEGDLVNFIISGVLEEEINYDPSYNPDVLATNAMYTSATTNSTIENIGYNEWIGNTRIIPTKHGYETAMFGSNATLGFEDAKNLIADLLTIQQVKANFQNNVYNTSEEGIEQLKNSVNKLSIDIADILSLSPYDVGMMITNYLKDPD